MSTPTSTNTGYSPKGSSTLGIPGGPFKEDTIYKGNDFFNEWSFFTGDDPTHGLVNYQSKSDAQAKNLTYIDGGATVLNVDDHTTLQSGQKRDSVRITSQKTWNSGLFIADFALMPFGCSLWPAYWSVGPNWPNGGEIDVVEGVNNQGVNQYTLHTSQGCTSSKGSVKVTGQQDAHTQCATTTDNTGCAYHDTDDRSYGKGFNDAGGGVFAHLWNQSGITVWFFSRTEIPENIQNGSPDPSSWGPPTAFWSSQTCNIGQHFQQHSLVIDTTLCGDWAGNAYQGCPGSCPEAVADPKNFQNAMWKINYIAVYQPTQ